MKKLLAILLVLVLSLGLFACGKDSDNDTTSENTTAENLISDTSEEQTPTAPKSSGFKDGDTGSGPAELDAGLIKFALPSGYGYEFSSSYINEVYPLEGSILINIKKEDTSDLVAKLDATTQIMVGSIDEAVENTISLRNLQNYEEGKAQVSDAAKYGENSYTKVDIHTEYGDETYFVTFVKRTSDEAYGLLVTLKVYDTYMKDDDPFIKELLDSVTVVK